MGKEAVGQFGQYKKNGKGVRIKKGVGKGKFLSAPGYRLTAEPIHRVKHVEAKTSIRPWVK